MSPSSHRLNAFARPFLALALVIPALRAWASPDELMVVGNQFVSTSTGCTIVLRGVNVDSLEYNSSGNDVGVCNDIVAATSAAITQWHANLIRIPLSQDFWFGVGNSKTATPNQAAYRALVDTLVGTCRNKNAYCLLDLHWSGNGTWGTAVQQENMPDVHSTQFWADVAARYANNPAVLFDLYNEPKGITDWGVWRNGDPTGSVVGFVSPGMQSLLGTIRTAGAQNVVVAGGLDWAYDLSGVPSNALTDQPGGRGVAYATHIYPWKGSAPWVPANGDAKIKPAGDLYPVIVGEFGQDASDSGSCGNCAEAGYPGYSTGAWMTSVITWMNLRGYSGTAWDFQRNSGPILLADCSYNPTAWEGVQVQSWLATATPIVGCIANYTPTLTMTPTPTNTPTATATGTLPTMTFTISYTPTNTLTITPTPVSTTCVTVFNGCESLGENGTWLGNSAARTIVDSTGSPPGFPTQGSHCMRVDITSAGSGWHNDILNLYKPFTPQSWDGQYQLVVDVYADPAFITASGGWHQLFIMADSLPVTQKFITTPNMYNLSGGANLNLTFTLNYGGTGINPSANLDEIYFIYNSQNNAIGNSALYFDNIRLVRGCSLTNTPTPTATGTPTSTSTATFTPTPTPTGTWFTDTPTFTVTFTPSPTGTPGAGTIETPIAYPNPFPYATPGVPGGDQLHVHLEIGADGPKDVTVKVFTLSFRKVLEKDLSNQATGDILLGDRDDKGQPLANGLYYLVVTDKKGNRAVGKMLIQR